MGWQANVENKHPLPGLLENTVLAGFNILADLNEK